jgi:uncharacterized repeat protein (TIGR01451 family)
VIAHVKKQRRVVTGALAVGAALGAAPSAEAANYIVTNTADSGTDSLRWAIGEANTNAGPDTVTFDAALNGQTIVLEEQIFISDAVDIQGPGSSNLTVSGNDLTRIFYIYAPGATPVDVTISGLTLTDGFAIGPGSSAAAGGAILSIGENLTLDDVVVSNSVAAGDGGGIAHAAVETILYSPVPVPATLTVLNSEISGNVANFSDPLAEPEPISLGGCGGGIFVGLASTVTIENTTVANNTSRCDGGGIAVIYAQDDAQITIQESQITGNQAGVEVEPIGNGGGVAVVAYSEGARTSIVDTTISDNSTNGTAGGLFTLFSLVEVQRSTISGNSAEQAGGGVYSGFSLTTLENTTIAGNTAYYLGAVGAFYSAVTIKETTISTNTTTSASSGAVGTYYGDAIFYVTNSIIANSIGSPDLYGSSFYVAHSLVEDLGGAVITDGGGNLNTDPQLGSLQNNGGPTATMKPAPTSPVVNAGDPDFAPPPATDQRGFARVVNGVIDMGSVEVNPGTLQFSVASQNVGEAAGTATVTVTRTGGFDGAASVQVSVNVASTATGGGSDYTLAPVTLNWADNDSSTETFNVTIVNDTADEPSETIVLDLATPTVAALGAPATHTITIVDDDLVADLNVTKTLAPGSLTVGGNATFTITVSNQGPDTATNVVVTDTLPPEVTFVSASPSCSGTTTITCSVGNLLSGQSTSVQIVVSLSAVGPVTNTASAASDVADGDGSDNQGAVTFTINARAAENIPALDPRMLMVLAALVAATALGALRRS